MFVQRKIYADCARRQSYSFEKQFPSIVHGLNSRKHRIIKMSPIDAEKMSSQPFLQMEADKRYQNFFQKKQRGRKLLFKVGDKVRISKEKTHFSRSYNPQNTEEIFIISKINNNLPYRLFTLTSLSGEPILGSFYASELTLVDDQDMYYLIDKVIKRRKNKLLVSWKGFEESANSWIDEKDLKHFKS